MPLASILSIDPSALLRGGDFTRRKNEYDHLAGLASALVIVIVIAACGPKTWLGDSSGRQSALELLALSSNVP
jgi:hypothetical protein